MMILGMISRSPMSDHVDGDGNLDIDIGNQRTTTANPELSDFCGHLPTCKLTVYQHHQWRDDSHIKTHRTD